ncbi:hypothetical protein H257_00930 [Aphanomyces astaci]|uniref:STI1 domain-containing protein n=1 Tax=Aphanomyces astaci TaxID=112090 RepID=W4H7M4_APHAT|nr:hypothetical protein H257_00930 [Aphanomyces astaci]ETV87304.1 hypothetical protein H257_00930 [Aphanomyces astaci]|eukprot:XP_009822167.1 hypothetical protein H257_00930 [Aphanomyces astaci]
MGGITEAEKVLLFSVLEFLAPLSGKDGVDAAKVQAGVKSLQEAFNVNPSDAALKQRLGLKNHSLLDIFTAGSKSLQLVTLSAPAAEDPVIAANPGLWQKWLAKLEAKGFFNGVSPGTSEYDDLYKKALSKFKEKFGSDKAPPSLSKEEKEAKAETLKASGNAALSAKDYVKAEQLYSEAIALSPAGPNSHIYLSNLAAAQMYLEKYDDVVDNCEKSIELNPKYVKAYSRLGAAYLQLEDIDLAIDAFSRGLEVDPTNDMCKSGLHDARNRQSHLQTRNAPPPAGGGGMPDLSALAGMMGGAGGGAGGLAGLMSNPAMQQMAAQMMQNPQMMAMAQNMMKDPAALSRMMGSMGGGGGGAPDLSSLLTPEAIESFRHSPQVNAMRGDPVMAEFFDDMDQGGPQAAMRHMSNPAVAAKLQGLLSNNMM